MTYVRDYQFIETKAPKHYVLDETPIDFTIEKGQKKTISLTAKNSLQQGSIELLKVDDLNDQMKLSDAVFNLLDQNGKVIKTDLKQIMKEKSLLKIYVPVRINLSKQRLRNIMI